MSQSADILSHMKKYQSITAMEALADYGCFRLAARINDLRARGHKIRTSIVSTRSGKRIALYSMAETN